MNRKSRHIFWKGIFCLGCCCLAGLACAQNRQIKLTLTITDKPFKVALKQVCRKAGVNKFFLSEHLEGTRRVTMAVKEMPLDSVLVLLGNNQPVTVRLIGNMIHCSPRKEAMTVSRGADTVSRSQSNARVLEHVFCKAYGKTNRILSPGDIAVVKKTPIGAVNGLVGWLESGVPGLRTRQLTGPAWGRIAREIRGTVGLGELQGTPNVDGPLIVVNGIPVFQDFMPLSNVSAITGDPAGIGPGPDPLLGFHQDGIDSVVVLKGPVSTAIFGARGANGVILATTNRGENASLQVKAHLNVGISEAMRIPATLNTSQWLGLHRLAYQRDGRDTAGAFFNKLDTTVSNDWSSWTFRNLAVNTTASASASIGRKSGRRLVFGSTHSTSQYPVSAETKQTWNTVYMAFMSFPGNRRWDLSGNLMYANGHTTSPMADPFDVIFLAPAISLHAVVKERAWSEKGVAFTNPLGLMDNPYEGRVDRWLANARVAYRCSKAITASVNIGWSQQSIGETGILKLTGQPPSGAKGSFTAARMLSKGVIIEPQADGSWQIGRIKYTMITGASLQEHRNRWGKLDKSGYSNEPELEKAVRDLLPNRDSLKNDYNFKSVFSGMNIATPWHLSAEVVGRGDASNKLTDGHTWGMFWAAGIAWRFSEMDWLAKDTAWLSFGKLYLGYGTTGSDYTGTDSVDKINWAVTRKFNVGIDLRLFDKLDVKAGFYCNTGHGQYLRLPGVDTTRYRLANSAAIIRNTGWEIELRWEQNLGGKTRLGLDLMATFPRNRLRRSVNTLPYNTLRPNAPVSQRMVYQYMGVENNAYKVRDVDGDGKITEEKDAVIARDLEIKAYGNCRAMLTVGRWSVFVNIEGRWQPAYDPRFEYYNRRLPGNSSMDQFNNQPVGFDKHPVITTRLLSRREDMQLFLNSNAMFRDGSYCLLRMAVVEYRLPVSKPESDKQKEIKLYIQGENLALITGYPGIGNPIMQKMVGLPALRSWTIGARFSFTKD